MPATFRAPFITYAVLAICVAGTPRDTFAQTASDPLTPSAIEFEFATPGIRRNNGLITPIGQLGNLGADFVLDKAFGEADGKSGGKAARRLAQLWFVNLPIAALTNLYNHDNGHFARYDEIGPSRKSYVRRWWPWPVPIAGSIEQTQPTDDTVPSLEQALAVVAGGIRGSAASRQTTMDRIYSRERGSYFDSVLLGYTVFDFTGYALLDLGITRQSASNVFGQDGDFEQYVWLLSVLPGGPAPAVDPRPWREDRRATIRKYAWLNLVDYGFYSAVHGVADYVISGERDVKSHSLSIGGVRMVPGLHAALGVFGPELGGDIRVIGRSYLTHVALNRIDTNSGASLWGGGVRLRALAPMRLAPEARIDIARQPEERTAISVQGGVRGLVPGTSQRLEFGVLAGRKNTGYVAEFPKRSGWLFSASATIYSR